jgi:hypothetical protein
MPVMVIIVGLHCPDRNKHRRTQQECAHPTFHVLAPLTPLLTFNKTGYAPSEAVEGHYQENGSAKF